MKEHKTAKTFVPWVLKSLITIGILWYLFERVPFSRVMASMSRLKPEYVIWAVVLQAVLRYINAVQLKIFSDRQQMRFSVFDLIKINFQTLFYGLLLPGVLSAGVVKWHKLSKENKMRAQAAVCVILARTMHILSLAILGVGFFLIEMPQHSLRILPVMVFGLIAALVCYAVMMNRTISGVVERSLDRWIFRRFPEAVRIKINKLWWAVKSFHELDFWTANRTILLAFLFHFVGTASVYCVMLAAGVHIPVISVVWISAAGMFIQLLPISISGLGVREGTFVFLLGKYGIPSSDAMAVSLTIFGFLIIMGLIGGIFEAREFFFQKRKEHNA